MSLCPHGSCHTLCSRLSTCAQRGCLRDGPHSQRREGAPASVHLRD